MSNSSNSESLASLALFRNIYDSGKDIYDVVSEFIKQIINDYQFNKFTTADIDEKLKSDFDFNFPFAVALLHEGFG
jgi:hypothetical protein